MPKIKQSRADSTSSSQPVPVVVRVEAGERVTITGDFTGWSDEGIAMSPLGSGKFRTFLKLSPGKYQYRLLVDGHWADDLETQERVGNPFGTANSVLVVA